jgi:hypothetical protein
MWAFVPQTSTIAIQKKVFLQLTAATRLIAKCGTDIQEEEK